MQEDEILYEVKEVAEDAPIIDESSAEIVDVEIFEAFQAPTTADSFNHALLTNREIHDAHPITAITGLREELDSIEALQTVYSDKKGNADYYEWADGHAIVDTGYFVTLNENDQITICSGDDIFGVVVDGAAFVGGQDDIARDEHYGLVATSGAVLVRCELDVVVGDHVVSNSFGWATKANSNLGYKVAALHNIAGVPYATIELNITADQFNLMGAELQGLDNRMDVAEANIVSAINVANEAYKMATETNTSNQEMSDKVDGALGTVDKVVTDVENLGTQVSNSVLISAQAKAIAESAATSAESMKNEAVEKANRALTETSKLRDEFKTLTEEIDAELDNILSETEVSKEELDSLREELQLEVDVISSGLETAQNDLINTRNELSSDIAEVVDSIDKTNGNVATITDRVDKNEASINSIVVWQGDTNTAISQVEQKADDNASNITTLTAWKSDVEGDVESIATIKTQSDANKSAIEGLTSWQETASESLTSIKQQSDANKASIDAITVWQGETEGSITEVKQQVDANESSISSLTSWKSEVADDVSSITSIKSTADANKASIEQLVKKDTELSTTIAEVKSTADANMASINSITSWQSKVDPTINSVAGIQQAVNEHESEISSLTSWQDGATESIAAIKQTSDKNSADILTITQWKSDVEDDVSSIASIKSTADANKASIEQLVKKDTELNTIIAGVKTTADANKASIEELVSWQSKVDPTINSVAGIKQTADGNAAKIEGLTTWQGTTNTAMARIEQKADANGAYIQSTVSNMDKYSVGPHSQAYGFTLEQAASVLEEGMIYVPTESVTETYAYGENQTYERTFTPQYLYMWGKIDGQYRWITVDKNYDETNETNTSSKAVYFTTTEPAVSGNFGYWYVNGDTTSGYEPHTLYKWSTYTTKDENGTDITESCWVPVATLAGNSSNRAVSQVRQDANSIIAEVVDAYGNVAGFGAKLSNTEATVQTLATWQSGVADDVSNISTIQNKADATGSSVTQIAASVGGYEIWDGDSTRDTSKIYYYDGNKRYYYYKNGLWRNTTDPIEAGVVINAASIVTAVNNDTSGVTITADRIDLTGYVKMTDLSGEGTTEINGANIITGSIKAGQIAVKDLSAFGATIGGWNIDENGISKGTTLINSNDDNQCVSLVSPDADSPVRISVGSDIDIVKDEFFDVQGTYDWKGNLSATVAVDCDGGELISVDVTRAYARLESYNAEVDKDYSLSNINSKDNTFIITIDFAEYDTENEDETLHIEYTYTYRKVQTTYSRRVFTLLEDGSLYASEAKFGTGDPGSDGSIFLSTTDMEGLPTFFPDTSEGLAGRQDWRLTVGSNFGVTSDGILYAKKAYLSDITLVSKTGDSIGFDIGKLIFTSKRANPNGENPLYVVGDTGVFAFTGLGGKAAYDMVFGWSPRGLQGGEDFAYGEHLSNEIRGLIIEENGTVGLTIPSGPHIALNDSSGSFGGTWDTSSAIATSSDRNLKHDIASLDDNYADLFDNLRPVKFKYNDGTSDRYHTGFIAQDVCEATENAGLTTQDFAAYVEFSNEDDSIERGLRYEEFIALCVSEIQKLKKRVTELEGALATQQND